MRILHAASVTKPPEEAALTWIGAVSALFKQAVLARYQEIHGEPPAVLHGHGFEDAGYDLARFLPLPDVGYPAARTRAGR